MIHHHPVIELNAPTQCLHNSLVFLQRPMSLTLLVVVVSILVVPRLLKWRSSKLA